MITVSDNLFERYQESDFYNFLFAFLNEHSQSAPYRSALQNRQQCLDLWESMFDPSQGRMDLALRHAFALGARIAGEAVDDAGSDPISPMQMKARLDSWGYVPFAAFNRRDD